MTDDNLPVPLGDGVDVFEDDPKRLSHLNDADFAEFAHRAIKQAGLHFTKTRRGVGVLLVEARRRWTEQRYMAYVAEVAAAFGITERAVANWRRAIESGAETISVKRPPIEPKPTSAISASVHFSSGTVSPATRGEGDGEVACPVGGDSSPAKAESLPGAVAGDESASAVFKAGQGPAAVPLAMAEAVFRELEADPQVALIRAAADEGVFTVDQAWAVVDDLRASLVQKVVLPAFPTAADVLTVVSWLTARGSDYLAKVPARTLVELRDAVLRAVRSYAPEVEQAAVGTRRPVPRGERPPAPARREVEPMWKAKKK